MGIADKIGLIFFVLLFAAVNVSSQKLRVRPRIISGRSATPGQFPFYVMIKYHADRSTQGGGSLISNDWVLTGAHVVNEVEFVVVFLGGTKMTDENLLNMTSYNIYAHPGFSFADMTHDIALVKLPEAVTFTEYIQPIPLPTFSMANESFVGTKIIVVGFGYTSDDYLRKLPDSLQLSRMTVIDEAQCKEELERKITNEMICAQAVSTGGTCNGDSGGPGVRQDKWGQFLQIGIISFGYDQRCELPLPEGLTRITPFLEWIHAATGLIKP